MTMGKDEEQKLLITNGNGTYGATSPESPVTSSPLKVIYCVHGRPSTGCCKVTEEILASSNGTQTVDSAQTENLLNEHCHRSRIIEVDKSARRKLITASILCVLFMIGEIIGGYLSHSLAIATDAAHLLTDFASFMVSLFSLWVASRPATKSMSFGWHRAEVIGAITSVLMIWVVVAILVYLAIERVMYLNFEIEAEVMLITSGIGVIVNLVMGCTLHQHGHTHGLGSHTHSAPNQLRLEDGKAHVKQHSHTQNINVRAAYIHVLGDLVQSLGVLLAATIIYFKPDWKIVDPICTFLFSIIVLATTFTIMKDALQVLMEGSPKGIDFTEVMNTFLKIEGVERVHNLRIWALSLDKTTLSAHLAIKPGINPQHVLMVATKHIHDKYNFFEMTLQIEEFNEHMEECKQCEMPAK